LNIDKEYVKVLMRRCQSYEALMMIDEALSDAKEFQQLDSSYPKIDEIITRLETLFADKMIKMFEERNDNSKETKDLQNRVENGLGLRCEHCKVDRTNILTLSNGQVLIIDEINRPAWSKSGVHTIKCSVCEMSYYCGTDCQKAAYKNHKLECANLRAKRQAMSGAYELNKSCPGCGKEADRSFVMCDDCRLTIYCTERCFNRNFTKHSRLCECLREGTGIYEKECKKNPEINADIFAPKEKVQQGFRVVVYPDQRHQFIPTDEPVSPILRMNPVRAGAVADICISLPHTPDVTLRVKAMWSSGSPRSSISRELATRLGLRSNGKISCIGLHKALLSFKFPSTYVFVESHVLVDGTVPMIHRMKLAPIISNKATSMMVLGQDWMDSLGEEHTLTYSPSGGSIATEGLTWTFNWDLIDKTSLYEENDQDMAHFIDVEKCDFDRLKALVKCDDGMAFCEFIPDPAVT